MDRGDDSPQSALLAADGRFTIDALLPGRYVMSGQPTALLDSSGRAVRGFTTSRAI